MSIPSISDVKAKGFNFAYSKDWLTPATARKALAMDAALITAPNATVPAYLLQYVSPDVIEILTAKQAARKIFSEKKVGDWITTNYQYQTEEYTGSTAPYADYGDGPASNANISWNVRDQYIFQTTISYGDREVDMSATAKVDLVARKQRGAAAIIDIDANKFYLQGVSGKRIYGMLNDPNLPAAITPYTVSSSVTWTDKIANLGDGATAAIYNDVLKLFANMQTNGGGLIDEQSPMKLLISPARSVCLNASTNFNISARQMIQTNFPNLTIETVPQLSGTAGETMMLVLPEIMGQSSAELAFGEKIRQGRLIPEMSSFKQKFSASTYGFCMRVPAAFGVMSGI